MREVSDIPVSLTFDDVLLLPGYSEVLPVETNIQTEFRET